MVTRAVREARAKKRDKDLSFEERQQRHFREKKKSHINFRFPTKIKMLNKPLRIDPEDRQALADFVHNKVLDKMKDSEEDLKNAILEKDPSLQFVVENSRFNFESMRRVTKNIDGILGDQELDLEIEVEPEWQYQDVRSGKTSSWKQSKRRVLKVPHLLGSKAPRATKIRNIKGIKKL